MIGRLKPQTKPNCLDQTPCLNLNGRQGGIAVVRQATSLKQFDSLHFLKLSRGMGSSVILHMSLMEGMGRLLRK